MADHTPSSFDPALLDLHLGHLTPAEAAALTARLATDRELAEQNETLQSIFAVLHTAHATQTPSGLHERVRQRIETFSVMPRVVRPDEPLSAQVEKHDRFQVLRLGSLREVVAVAAMIVLAIGLGVPGLMELRQRGQRVGCSWNLAQLGAALQQYANTFNASLPFAGWDTRNSWSPSSDPWVVNTPNRRHVYPLLARAYVADPRLFVCPSQRGVPMPKDAVARHSDFVDGRNLTYAYQNMAGVRPSAHDDPNLPIMADENPLFQDGVLVFDVRRLPWVDAASINSRAHGGAGQNVLTLGGQVRWSRSPNAGVDGDNIWTLRGVTSYTGREGPLAATDSHLLK